MRVTIINGSPALSGSTAECVRYLETLFKEDGIETVVLKLPNDIKHCVNCRKCKELNEPCLSDDYIRFASEIIENSDGLIIGSPVYYYSITSQLQAFITRLCYSRPHILEHKLCSFFSVSRRTGNTNCFDQIMKVFQMHNAIMVGGNYVNEIYGDKPEELQYDSEGMLSLKMIEKNFFAVLPLIKEMKFCDEKKVHTNFISREFLSYVKKEKELNERNKLLIEAYDCL